MRVAAMTAVVMFVVSCSGLLKKKGDEEDAGGQPEASTAEVADTGAAPVPVAVALATNEGNVARFPDETKLADVAATTLRAFNVREAPPAGALIQSLPKGTVTTQIASRAPYFLVLFDDTAAPGTKKMGWIHKDAYSAVIVDAGVLTCPAGEVPLVADTPFCGKLCQADTECPAGQACKGSGSKLMPNGKPGDNVSVCIVFQQPKQKNFGRADAGAKPIAPTVDAAAPPAPTPTTPNNLPDPGVDVVPPTAGKCPANFLLVNKTGKCHRPCASATGGDCKNKPSFFCIKCDNDTKKVCADTRDQCK